MRTFEIDYSAPECPCCKAARSGRSGEWPWRCACYKACEVAAMGRTCGGTGCCWTDCPYRAPEECPALEAVH